MKDLKVCGNEKSVVKAPPFLLRWLVLFLVSLPMFGNYYIYDSINPLGDIFIRLLGFTDTHIGWLNASYSVAALLTLLAGGIIIDRVGVRQAISLFSILCFVGAAVTAAHGSFYSIVAGRVILGLGAESLIVAVSTALAKWFKGKELSFAFGIKLTIARLASVAADNSPFWAGPVFYPAGPQGEPSWQGPLLLAVGAGLICVVGAAAYWWVEGSAEKRYALGKAGEIDKLDFRKIFRFSSSYWFIVGLCFTFYAAIFPFRTFAIKFFMHTHFAGVPEKAAREAAGFFNSFIPMSAMVATPLFGLLVDRVGRRALLMTLGTALLMPVYLIMVYTKLTLWVPVAMMGVAFSLIPAVLWPSVAYIVDEKRLGTAYALMTFLQQIGFIALNLVIGKVNVLWRAGADNPGGYTAGMWIFTLLVTLGFFFAFLLWRTETKAGSHGLETIRAGKKP